MKSVDNNGGKWFQFAAAVIVNLMAITDGIAVGWTAPLIPYFLSPESPIIMSREEAEWMESSLLLGAFCGLPLTAFAVQRVGRKRSVLFGCTILIGTWVVIALVNDIIYINVARFFQGLGLNMAFVSAPMYVGEISHKSIRGFLCSLSFVLSLFGVVVIYSVGPFLPFYVPCVTSIVLLVIEIALFSFMPESPHFLIYKGRQREAIESLKKFRNSSNVEDELNEITQSIKKDTTQTFRLKEFFSIKNYRKAFVIMIILNVSQLFCAFEVMLMNLHEILEAAGTVYMSASTAGIIFSVINFVSSVIAAAIVDKFGRKILLVVSTISTGIILLVLGVYFHLKHLGFDTISYSWLPIVSAMAYAAVFKMGLGMVPIVITSEIFASKVKAAGMTFADGVYVISSLLALQVYFAMRNNIGMYAPFYTFFGCSILTLICILYFIPETKGKTLDEIQEILKK